MGGNTQGTVSDVDVKISNVELQFRYHPTAAAFYFGVGAGNHVVNVTKTEIIQSQSVTGEAKISASYVTPQFGWVATWDSGFTLGFELGWLLPTSNTTEFSSNAPAPIQGTQEYADLKKDVEDQGDQLGKSGVPYVTLLRLGWVF